MKLALVVAISSGLLWTNSTIAGPIKTSCDANRATRAMLKVGMTYAEVVAIIGCEGVLLPVIMGKDKMYQWSAKGPAGSYLRVGFSFGDKMTGAAGFLPL